MLLLLLQGETRLALSLIVTEFLAANAIAQFINYKRKTLGLWISVAGYVSWTFATTSVSHLLGYSPQVRYSFPPEILLGIGMMLLLMEESLFDAQRLGRNFKTIFESSPHMMWMIDPLNLRIITANQAAAEGHGYSLHEFKQLQVTDIIHPDTAEQIAADVRSAAPKPSRASIHRRKDGNLFPIDIEGRSVQIDGRQHRLVIGVDVTEREQLLSLLREQAINDSLTNLLNRRGFQAASERLIQEVSTTDGAVALISFNIRQFKTVNDTYGDAIGDRCLQAIASRLRDKMQTDDIAARTGGDEFKIIFRHAQSSKAAEQLASSLLQSLLEPYRIDDVSIRLAFNMGLATAPEDGTDAATLRRKAMSAMAHARTTGAQRPCRFSSEDAAAAREAVRLGEAIREMLQNNSFQVHYQPICAPDGTVKSLEALLRMHHPELGNVSPAKFIPVAEDTRLIIPLGQWVLEHVCRQLSAWAKEGIPIVPVAVNISALQFRSSDFGNNILRTMETFHLPKNLIYLELTESTVLRNAAESLEAMRSIASSGIRFAIDDFGTGYSSLGRLRDMPISTLKIDRSFIQKLRPNDTLVEAIISLAHALQMDVVAEGVETEEQLEILRSLDCDSIQGYLLGRPAPAKETAEILRNGTLIP
ncbi:MAG: GGDEF domain-containing protein [Acidobacteria bacterium]|nr:GGDEF domain-containing protein [Acidobacteriota bacterium]